MRKEPGQALREAWIAGVNEYRPGTPPPGYITPWKDTAPWEKACAAAVERYARLTILTFRDEIAGLTDDQRGQFIANCWITEILGQVPEPKASYLRPWNELPEWQKKTDIGIFHVLEDLALNQPPAEIPHYSGDVSP